MSSTRPSAETAESIAAFAAHIGRMRAARGWSLREMASRCGNNASTLMRAEHGNDLMLGNALQIASVFGVPLGELLVAAACEQCQDTPPPGFTCNGCGRGAEVPRG